MKNFRILIATQFILIFFLTRNQACGQQPVIDTVAVQQDTLKKALPDSLLKQKFIMLDTVRFRFIGDGNFTRGNVNRTLMVLRAEWLITGPYISISTNPRFTYGKQNGVLAERDSYLDLFVDVFKKKRTYVFGLAILENSNLRRIKLREMAGAGVGYRVMNSKTNTLTLTDAIVYESTNFVELPTVTTIRNSFRIKGKHSLLSDKIRLSHITFIQPALNDLSNLRWNTIFSFEFPVNKYVTLRTSFENSYERVVEIGRKRNDSRLTFGFSIGNK